MKTYAKVNVGAEARTELHDSLQLTGAEVSINHLPAGTGVPFVHSHKQNEEIYVVLSGKGKVVIDGETILLTSGDWLRISPQCKTPIFCCGGFGDLFCLHPGEAKFAGSLDGERCCNRIVMQTFLRAGFWL